MLKVTQSQLKRGYKQQLKELLTAIRLKCCDCMGFYLDGYARCASPECPLFKFQPSAKPQSKLFRGQMACLAIAYGNPKSIINKILGKGEKHVSKKKSLASSKP